MAKKVDTHETLLNTLLHSDFADEFIPMVLEAKAEMHIDFLLGGTATCADDVMYESNIAQACLVLLEYYGKEDIVNRLQEKKKKKNVC